MSVSEEHKPQKWEDVKSIFKVDFKSLPNLPVALEDVYGGIINDDLIVSSGFGGSYNRKNSKPFWKKYKHRFFFTTTYKLDLNNTEKGFEKIVDFPGIGRQDGGSVVVNNELYTWGGFTYIPATNLSKKVLACKKNKSRALKDGYKLSNVDGVYKWEKLPDLPYAVCSFSLTNVGSKIYLYGGSHYHDSSFYTWGSFDTNVKDIGSGLLVIDLNNLKDGWKILSECPGTPRMLHTGIAVDDNLYFFGGASGREFQKSFCSTVDNWKYDTKNNKWERLLDCPSSQTNWKYSVLYKNKYVLLVGGCNINGSIKVRLKGHHGRNVIDINKKQRKGYGVIRQNTQTMYLDENHNEHKVIKNTANKVNLKPIMCGEILAYDTSTNVFCKLDNLNNSIPLPVNINAPLVAIRSDKIYVVGGESDISTYNNITYGGLSTDIALVGQISEI